MQGNQLVQFDKLSADITLAVKPIHAMAVTNEATLNEATLAGKNVKHFAKLVEDKRKELVKPLNDQVKIINDYAKKIMAPLDGAEMHIKGQLRNYEITVMAEKRKAEQERFEREKKEREEQAAAKAKEDQERIEFMRDFGAEEAEVTREEIIAQASKEREAAEIAQESKAAAKEIAQTKVSNTRKVWKFEVQDSNLVPREFLMVDEKAIRAAVAEGKREIPGVRIFEDIVVALR